MAERSQDVDAAALASRDSDGLSTCSDKLVLRIEGPRPLAGSRPVYRVDIMDMCWQWHAAALDGLGHVAVSLGELPWNYQLAHDLSKVVVRPLGGKTPALEVHLDDCSGQILARLPLPEPNDGTALTLSAPLTASGGDHDLCFLVTGDPKRHFWALDRVQLNP